MELLEFVNNENFAMVIAVILLLYLTRDLKREIVGVKHELSKLHKSIERNSKSVLLLVLAENGTRKQAKKHAEQMLRTIDEEDST